MKLSLRQVGHSKGIILPRVLLEQTGFESEVEAEIKRGKLILSRPCCSARKGWSEAAKALSDAGEDQLVWPEFANADDTNLQWRNREISVG